VQNIVPMSTKNMWIMTMKSIWLMKKKILKIWISVRICIRVDRNKHQIISWTFLMRKYQINIIGWVQILAKLIVV